MTTRVYERHLCSYKDTGEFCGRFHYFKNSTSYDTAVFDQIGIEIKEFLDTLLAQGKWRGEHLLDEINTATLPGHPCIFAQHPYTLPEGYEITGQTIRIGDRWYLTDMTMEEYEAMELEFLTAQNLTAEYQELVAATNQMRNDPAIVWRMDWTLVSTTP